MNLFGWLKQPVVAAPIVVQPMKEPEMADVSTIEKDFETVLAEAQTALPAIQTMLTMVGMFVPQAKIAATILSGVMVAAPTLLADVKKVAADLEAALGTSAPATPSA